MNWSLITWVAVAAGAVVAFFVVQLIHLSTVLAWADQKTTGLAYYGLPAGERRRFKDSLRRQARLLRPILRLMSRFSRFTFQKASFEHRGIAGPRGTCSKQSFERADEYVVREGDVFVATQMKCGTTWMQHVVYEVLHRGRGDLVPSETALCAVSPWLEAFKTVPVEDAPLLGSERPSRVIKTHLPATLCPDSDEARYVYVARHPVSCFASCVDFIAANVGAMAPELDQVEEWYCDDELMWWGTWPSHVRGWWERAARGDNVLFVHFEEMKRDLPGVVRRVAGFLELEPFTEAEIDNVVRKCGFEYMREHEDTFEMHPPHLLATDAELFVKGTADRHKDVPEETRRRILSWCAERMNGSDYPLGEAYPDVIAAPASESGAT
jgi:aryl sulfotransferase